MLTLLALAGLSIVSDPDGVVSTAPRGPDAVVVGAVAPTAGARPDASLIGTTAQSLTTAQQIDRWLAARSPSDLPFPEDRSPTDDRKMHGFVSGSIGTGDYSAVDVGVSLPIGESGRLDLSYSQSRNGYGGYGGYGYGYPGDGYARSGLDPRFSTWDRFQPRSAYGQRWGRDGGGKSQSFSLSYDSTTRETEPFPDR